VIVSVPFPAPSALGAVKTTAALLQVVYGTRPSPQMKINVVLAVALIIPLAVAAQSYNIIRLVGLISGGGP
jgi:hypothetical protein